MASQFLQPGRSSAAMVIEELVESAVERAFEAVKYAIGLLRRWPL